MKNSLIALAVFGLLNTTAMTAKADNGDVEGALQRRADLSSFYQALVNTGVSHELNPGTHYTVFAPTNEAMAKIRQDQYPCFYMQECSAQVAQILRNHIVSGDVYVDDAAKQVGGFYSINKHFVTVGMPSRNDYAVNGNNVIYMSSFGGGILYKIDGVIASPRELASVQYPVYAYDAPQQVTTVTKRVIAQPSCGPAGCADSTSEVTTITSPIVAPYPPLSPSAAGY